MRTQGPLLLILLLLTFQGRAQYVLNGSAQQLSCNCYSITGNTEFQSGSVWNANKISLSTPFDFWFNVNLGCNDANGADGMVFILQPLSTNVGSSGEGMGFGGIVPSVGIAMDTYRNANLNDPDFDHISIQTNGRINHTFDLDGPVPISDTSDNVEDCQWHILRITWDPVSQDLRAYFDGSLRLQKQVDLVGSVFNGDPNVYWGFSGATGGSYNVQQFCTALNPRFTTNTNANLICTGTTVSFTNISESFAPILSYTWNFGDNTTSNLQHPPPHTYNTPGTYPVRLTIVGADGCSNSTTTTLIVSSAHPSAAAVVSDACAGRVPQIQFQAPTGGTMYQWAVDGNPTTLAALAALPTGMHQLRIIATSPLQCGPNDTSYHSFSVKPSPMIAASANSVCLGQPALFSAQQTDNATTIGQWHWQVGNLLQRNTAQFSYTFPQTGVYPSATWALATNGCSSDTIYNTVRVNEAFAFAGNDTIVPRNTPFLLHGQGNGTQFLWSPAFGLSDAGIPDPTLTPSGDQSYVLKVTTQEGCVAYDTVRIRAFDGPAVYVPSAFTPNGDGRNDVVAPLYVGMRSLVEFAVYNRWGQKVFHTSDKGRAWDGSDGGQGGTQTFVWTVRAVDMFGKTKTYQGTITRIQ